MAKTFVVTDLIETMTENERELYEIIKDTIVNSMDETMLISFDLTSFSDDKEKEQEIEKSRKIMTALKHILENDYEISQGELDFTYKVKKKKILNEKLMSYIDDKKIVLMTKEDLEKYGDILPGTDIPDGPLFVYFCVRAKLHCNYSIRGSNYRLEIIPAYNMVGKEYEELN